MPVVRAVSITHSRNNCRGWSGASVLADHVVATTEEIRDHLCTGAIAESDVSVIGNGIKDVYPEIAAVEAAIGPATCGRSPTTPASRLKGISA